MSDTPVVTTTPILSASPGPATTNTYMRFTSPFNEASLAAAALNYVPSSGLPS